MTTACVSSIVAGHSCHKISRIHVHCVDELADWRECILIVDVHWNAVRHRWHLSLHELRPFVFIQTKSSLIFFTAFFCATGATLTAAVDVLVDAAAAAAAAAANACFRASLSSNALVASCFASCDAEQTLKTRAHFCLHHN
jgi:hypothetical protein